MNVLFWSLVPNEALILLLAVAALGLMVGARRFAASLAVITLAIAVAGPFAEAAAGSLDVWVQMAILGVFCLILLRAAVGLVLGPTTASHLAALILHDLLLAPFRVLRWILRRRG